jgi:O-antigen/teichoic acid export membrane protein
MPTRSRLPEFRQVSINVSATWLLKGATLLFSLVTVPLISRRFGLEGLGVWLLVQQVASHFQLLELGLASSLERLLSRDAAKKDYLAYTGHSSTAAAMLAVIGALLILIALPAGSFFPEIFDIPLKMQWDASAMMVIALVSTGLLLPLRSAIGVLASLHRFDLQMLVDAVALALRFALVITVSLFVGEHALVALAVAIFGPGILAAIAMYAVALRLAPAALLDRSMIGRAAIVNLLGISLSAMMITFAAVLLRQGSALVAGYSLGLDAVPMIALPVMIVACLAPFLGVANQMIAPVASQLDAVGNKAALLDVYLMASRYVASIGLIVFFAVTIAGPTLLPIWLGREVFVAHQLQILQQVLLVVWFGYCAALPALLGRTILGSVGKHYAVARGEVAGAFFGVVFGWALMDLLKLGAVGMAYGIACTYLLRGGGPLMYRLAAYFGMSYWRLTYDLWLKPLLTGLPLLLSVLLVTVEGRSLTEAMLLYSAGVVLWGWTFWKIIIPAGHRAKFKIVAKSITQLSIGS